MDLSTTENNQSVSVNPDDPPIDIVWNNIDEMEESSPHVVETLYVPNVDTSEMGNLDDMVIQYENYDSDSVSDSADDDNDPTTFFELESDMKEKENELTSKFLSGELSFSEYAALMEGDDSEEVIVEQQPSSSGDTIKEKSSGTKETSKKAGSKLSKRKRRPKHLPPALKGLMGEANLRYARGERDLAIQMCMEVIRQVPTAPDPFQMLAMLYDELGSSEKSLQFALIAAHLDPRESEQWIRLAAMSLDHGKPRQAVTCYTKAIKADPKNIDHHLKRAKLLEDIGDIKQANRAYMRLLNTLTSDQGPTIIQMTKMVAMKYHEQNELVKAHEAMDIAFQKAPDLISSEEVNMMLELLLSMKKYQQCLKIFTQHCGVVFETETVPSADGSTEEINIVNCSIPDSMAIDLRSKLTVFIIHLKAFHLTDILIGMFMSIANSEEDGDLYLDVAEALISEGKHEDALKLTTPLVSGSKYSLPAVWLRHAECLNACQRLEEAAAAYKILVQQAPQHLEARLTLAGLLNQLGCGDQALVALTQDPEKEVLDPGLLYERCMLLKDTGRSAEFLSVGQLLLSRHCVCIRNREELSVLSRLRRVGKRKTALLEVRKARGEPQTDPNAPYFEDGKNAPTVEEEWQLLLDLCLTCIRVRRFDLMQRFAFSALGSKRFLSNDAMRKETEFLCLLSCFYNIDTYTGYNLVRELVLRGTASKRTWNVFNLVIQRADHVRQNRFFIRLMMRHLDHEGLLTLHANSCLVAGTYKYALIDYVSAFRVHPNPLVALLIGVTLFQIACQKFTARKNSLIIQGLAFFSRYQQLRGPEGQQEVNYNIGRAFHQLGLFPAAIHQYEKVLSFKSNLNTQYSNLLDLKREAAFNLHLIYLRSEAHDLATFYLHNYIVI